MDIDYREAMKMKNQLCFPLYIGTRSVISLYTPLLKPYGLTYTQYLIFLVLWEKDGLAVGEIGSKLGLDNGTLSPLLKKMQKAGYIDKQRSDKDERVVLITLTAEGKAIQKKLKDVPTKIREGICLPQEKIGQIVALMQELTESIGARKPGFTEDDL